MEVVDASQCSGPFSRVMEVVLGIIAIAVLLVLIVASMRRQRETRAAEKQRADSRADTGQAQHEDSLRRRAQVRAAHAERKKTIADSDLAE